MVYTATYRKIPAGYLGQILEWPQVVTEGQDLEDCRAALKDALSEMIAAYRDDRQELPGSVLYEPLDVSA